MDLFITFPKEPGPCLVGPTPPWSLANWKLIIAAADRIALGYATSVTLRQLHYRLVASGVGNYVNSETCYQTLSEKTSALRRTGDFPPLSDLTRGVNRPVGFADPADALDWLARLYRRDRTEDQKFQTWVLYEKATLERADQRVDFRVRHPHRRAARVQLRVART